MPTRQLKFRPVERVWGRRVLPFGWVDANDRPIGEIWFEDEAAGDAELLVKFLFTSDRLSIQVHPDDAAARAIGFPRGKDEAWVVLDAAPGAVIGLGLAQATSREALKAAAQNGGIEQLMDWRSVKAGEFYYSPAGTVHAIGAGLTLIEIQQNLDLTYRLYDYGRPRELHLNAGVEAADPLPWRPGFSPRQMAPGRMLLHAGGAFVLERWTGGTDRLVEAGDASILLIPVRDGGLIDGAPLELGTVLRLEGKARLTGDCAMIATYPGAVARPRLLS